MTRSLLLCLALAGCVQTVPGDAGCLAYGTQRATMPPLGMDPLSEWTAVLDSSMTGACHP